MSDLKDILKPFLIPNPMGTVKGPPLPSRHKVKASTGGHPEVKRFNHPTGNSEFDQHFKIGSNQYTDNTYGSVSIRALTPKGQLPYFACFLSRKEINSVIEALQSARDTAFPEGSKPYAGYYEA